MERPEGYRASNDCCMNFGCPNPEFCDTFGWSCGDPNQPHGEAFIERLKEIGSEQ